MAGAGIFFTDGKKFLLLKRGKGDHEGKWCIPGGGLKKGESPFEAAKRESIEECGTAEGSKFAQIKEEGDGHSWTTFFFRIKDAFDCKLSREHTDYAWVKFSDAKRMDLHPSMKKNLSRHLSVAKSLLKFKDWI